MIELENAKLTGYVLVNEKDKLLVHKKFWASRDMTEGWIWSEEEIEQIKQESKTWDYKPTHKQAAYLNRSNGSTVVYGKLEIL